VNSAIT